MNFLARLPIRSFSALLLAAASAARAQDPSAPPAPPSDRPVLLAPVIVSDELDNAREDIVPALGATQYTIGHDQIAVEPLGDAANFNEVLLRGPGMAEDSFGQLHIRGEHANLQYRINDVVIPEGISGFGQELDTPFVKTLSIETGSLPAQFGFRTAGIVDIHTITPAPGSSQGGLDILGGSFNTQRIDARAQGAEGAFSGFAIATFDSNDLGIENPTGSASALHDQTHQGKVFSEGSWVIDSTSRLSLLVSTSVSTFQIPDSPGQQPSYALAGVPTFNSAELNENQREDNAFAIVAYQKTAGDLSLQVSAFTRYSLVEFEPDVAGDLIFNGVSSRVYQDLSSDGLEMDARWLATATHTLRFGIILIGENAGTSTTNEVFPTSADGNQTSASPIRIEDDSRKLGWLYGAYVQDEWKPLANLTVNYGLRADASDAYLDEGQLSPRLNLVYQLGQKTTLHAGYARYFTPPPLELVQPADLAKFSGTTNAPAITADSPVRSERSHYFDAGITQQLGDHLSVSLDGYDKKAVQQLDEGQFGAALIFAPFNYLYGRVYGAEFSANYTAGGFAAYANIASGRARGETVTSGQYQFDPVELAYIQSHWVHLDHDQALTTSSGVSYSFDDNLVYSDFLYGSGLRSGFANTGHVAEHHPVNAGFEHDFHITKHKAIKARLDVSNIFDEVYELRDGSGIGVFAPQYGQRRGIFASIGYAY